MSYFYPTSLRVLCLPRWDPLETHPLCSRLVLFQVFAEPVPQPHQSAFWDASKVFLRFSFGGGGFAPRPSSGVSAPAPPLGAQPPDSLCAGKGQQPQWRPLSSVPRSATELNCPMSIHTYVSRLLLSLAVPLHDVLIQCVKLTRHLWNCSAQDSGQLHCLSYCSV